MSKSKIYMLTLHRQIASRFKSLPSAKGEKARKVDDVKSEREGFDPDFIFFLK